MGTFRSNNRGFRNQQLAATPRARTRLYDAQAALLEQGLRTGPQSIIGGQFVDGGDTAGLSAAITQRDTRNNEYQARAAAQRSGGSRTVTRGAPGGLAAGNPLLQPPEPGMDGDPTYPGGPAFQDLLDPQARQGGQFNVMQRAEQDFGAGEPRAPLRSAGRDYQSSGTGLSDEFEQDQGFRKGGQVQGLRELRRGGEPVSALRHDDPEFLRSIGDHKQATMASPRSRRGVQPKWKQESSKGGNTVHRRLPTLPKVISSQEREVGLRRGGQVPCFNQGGAVHPGMVKTSKIKMPEPTGPIGDPAMDTGEDTVDAVVRPGEVLLNPPTVEYFGDGDYDEGLRVLNKATMAATGEPMGAEYEGDKLHAAAGGIMYVDEQGNTRQRFQRLNANAGPQQPQGPRGFQVPPENINDTTQNQPKAKPSPEELRRQKYTRAGEKVGRGVKKVGNALGALRKLPVQAAIASPLAGFGDYDVDPTVDEASFFNPSIEGLKEGAVNTGLDTLSGMAKFADTAMDVLPGVESQNYAQGLSDRVRRDIPTAITPYGAPVDSVVAEQQQVVPQEVAPPPAPYGRAFGEGDVDLRDMNVVQRTGGPGEEVIVREDIDGVPTFTNLRRGGFDGSTRNLQTEADTRAVQDQAIGLRNAQVVEQMRNNAPVRTQAGVDQRRQEDILLRQTEIEAAGRRRALKATDIAQEKNARFQRPVLDEDGQVTKYIDDPDAVRLFDDTISKLNPAIVAQFGAPFDQLPRETRMEVYDYFNEVKQDTIAGNRAGSQLGVPTSEVPRTGVNSLRGIPGDISLGDVWGPNFTLADYAAGVGDGDSLDDVKVEDPVTGGQMSLRQLLQQHPNAGQEALERYGIDPARFK